MQLDDTLLLIEPVAAAEYESALQSQSKPAETPESKDSSAGESAAPFTPSPSTQDETARLDDPTPTPAPESKPRDFHGSVDVNPSMAKFKFADISDEIIALLTTDPNANVRVTLEISAEFPDGASDQIRRAVSENANNLNFKSQMWE